jgi:hypothetical protein
MAEPVFYDPRRARWKRLRRFFDVTAVLVSALLIFFVYSALRDEPLPELLFFPQKRPLKALKETEKEKAKERAKKAAARSHRKTKLAASQVKLNQEEGIRAAFYVPWDAASFSSLRSYARQIDMLFPDWLHVFTPDGRLQGVDDQTNKYFDVVQGNGVLPVDDKVMPFLRTEVPAVEVFPMVNNSDGANWVDVSEFLNNPDARALFRKQAGQFLSSGHFRGFRGLPVQRTTWVRRFVAGIVRGSACARAETVRRCAASQRRIRLPLDSDGGRRRHSDEL